MPARLGGGLGEKFWRPWNKENIRKHAQEVGRFNLASTEGSLGGNGEITNTTHNSDTLR